jgi:GGDEF domain-containing protein/uncharacterized integral membrane protein
MQLFVVLALAIAFLAVLFALQNTAAVTITFFAWTFDESLAVVLLATLMIGVVIGLLVSVPALVRRNWSISRKQKQIESLEFQIQEQNEEKRTLTASHAQDLERLKQHHLHLLSALSITEPLTGFLSLETAPRALSYLLSKTDLPADVRSVCVYRIEQNELHESSQIQDQPLRRRVFQAIAARLQSCATPNSWLHSDGVKQLVCITPELNPKSALEYGETMRAALSDAPITLEDGTTLSPDLSIGGAIADTTAAVDGAELLDKAAAALDNAKHRGQNRFRLEQVTH